MKKNNGLQPMEVISNTLKKNGNNIRWPTNPLKI